MTIFLASATAVALIGLGLTISEPLLGRGDPGAVAQEATIRRFYAAVDGVLNGGDPDAFDAFVAPEVVVHLAGRELAGASAWERHVAAIAAASPGQNVQASDVLATGDRAATTIERVGSTRPAPGVVIEGAPPRQERTEAFRFASGRIVEYWSALDDTAFARSLPPLSMPLPAGMKQAALVRFALPPGAVLADLSEPGPELLLPETGAVTVAVDESAELARAGAIAEGWRPATAKQELTLGPGDALLVPAGAHRAIRNETSAGATMLGLLIYSLADISGVRHPPPLTALYATTPYGRSVPIDGATAMLLERGTDGCAACRDGTLRVVWAPLAPGQHLAVEPNAGLSFLATEAGAVATGDRRFGPATGTLDAPTAGETAEARVVAAGAAVAVPSGGSVSFATAANAGASLLLIDIGMPVPDAAISPSGA